MGLDGRGVSTRMGWRMILANEKFADCSTECAMFVTMHWEELFGKKKFRANWKAVEALERLGSLPITLCVTI